MMSGIPYKPVADHLSDLLDKKVRLIKRIILANCRWS